MTANHLEILVEEPSMEAFLAQLLPRLLGERATFTLHVHQGKRDLFTNFVGGCADMRNGCLKPRVL